MRFASLLINVIRNILYFPNRLSIQSMMDFSYSVLLFQMEILCKVIHDKWENFRWIRYKKLLIHKRGSLMLQITKETKWNILDVKPAMNFINQIQLLLSVWHFGDIVNYFADLRCTEEDANRLLNTTDIYWKLCNGCCKPWCLRAMERASIPTA